MTMQLHGLRAVFTAHRMTRVALLVLAASSYTAAGESDIPGPAWPPPPAQARIHFVHSFSRASDLGWKRGLWRRIVDWVMDEGDGARLRQPFAIAVDSRGRLLIADTAAREVKIFDPDQKSVRRIRGWKGRQFGAPVGVAADADQNVYVVDAAAGLVLKFSRDGKLLGFLGGPEGAFKQPSGIAYSYKTGLLYVVDTMRPRVFVYRPDGTLVRQFGERGNGPGQFNFPTFVAVDRQGNVYVNDTLNFRIQVFDPDSKFVRTFGLLGDGSGNMSRPKGLAIDSEGHVYIGDAMFSTVQIFDGEGDFLLNFGDAGPAFGQFYIPAGIAIDGADFIFVADPYQGRVEMFRYIPAPGQQP